MKSIKQVKKKKEVAEIQLNDLTTVAIILVVAGLVIAFGIEILSDTRTDIGEDECAARSDALTTYDTDTLRCTDGENFSAVGSADFNATGNTISGVEKLSTKMTTIASVVVGVIIIGLLFAFFRFTRK